MEHGDRDGWVALDPSPWWTALVTSRVGLAIAFVPILAAQVGAILEFPPIGSIGLAAGSGVLAAGALMIASRLFYPRAYVNPTKAMIRIGRKQARYADINDARLIPGATKKRRSLLLLLQTPTKLQLPVLLRDARQNTLGPEVTALMEELLRQSNIEMPASPDDPKGRFARFNFPSNITKDEALQLVTHPPTAADRLPIPWVD
jgi:hypothetical protein